MLQTIADNDLAANAQNMGNRLMAGLRQLATRHELIGDVRGRGLLIGVDLVTDRESKAPAAMAAAKIAFRAWQLGVNLFVCGMHANVLELSPALILGAAEVTHALEVLDAAIGDVAAGKVSDAAVAPYSGQ